MSRPPLAKYIPQLPDGWVKCPRFGDPRLFHGLNIIPCKVPLSHRFNQQVGLSGRWTLADAIRQFRGYGMEVGTVIDLTKSRNYYDFGEEMQELGSPDIHYAKVACRGRGESPQPAEVNEAVWHIFNHQLHIPDKYILLHCTHGFNRTGYVIVAALMRLRRDKGFSVRRAVERFAQSRPPGIYKDQYINDLFKYYHEGRDFNRTITPRVPRWKGNDDAEDAADAANEDAAGEDGGEAGSGPVAVHHEDIKAIGEPVCEDEANWIRQQVCALLPLGGGGQQQSLRFPGMQPVSLSMERLRDLETHRYHVTWKADGTRYMVFILTHGTYVMDRSFNVVRCEMRFNNGIKRLPPGQKPNYAVSKPMDMTLLDGEMVVDVDPEGKQPPRLRYLIYDVCMINGNPLMKKPWKERYRAIESDIINPRTAEREYIERWRGRRFDSARAEYRSPPLDYAYNMETFAVRRKPFWPVFQIDKVFESFNDPHKVGHDSDGLILQGYEDSYTPGTCELLYKWKFAHMNSVDFLLRCKTVPGPDGPGGPRVLDSRAEDPLELLLLDQKTSRGARINYVSLQRVDPDGHYRVEFAPEVDPLAYDGKLVECTFDRARGVWLFMRERRDKDTPNGSRVYLRIKESIINHVDKNLLVGTLKQALLGQECYASDLVSARQHPGALEALRKDVDEWWARRQEQDEQQRRQQLEHRARPPPGAADWAGDDADEVYRGGEEDEEPWSPPGEPASPPPAGYFDGDPGGEDLVDIKYELPGHGDGDGAGGGPDDGAGGYRVSDADPEGMAYGAAPHAGTSRAREPGSDEGGGEGRPRRRITRWPPDIDEPDPVCPTYEGYGFD